MQAVNPEGPAPPRPKHETDTGRLNRRAPVHLPVRESGNRSRIVFLTVCTRARKRFLANPEAHDLLVAAWRANPAWAVGRYMIMPDHIHLFTAPCGHMYPRLVQWVAAWKAFVSRHWKKPHERPLWQRSFWDRQLRSGDSHSAKWHYVLNNPVRHGLVENSADWPYQGEMTHLRWHH